MKYGKVLLTEFGMKKQQKQQRNMYRTFSEKEWNEYMENLTSGIHTISVVVFISGITLGMICGYLIKFS